MSKNRKKYSPNEKAKIALEALKGTSTLSQITSKYKIHSSQISAWKKRLKENIGTIFQDKKIKENDKDELIEELYKKIGQLQLELDWLKKKSELFE